MVIMTSRVNEQRLEVLDHSLEEIAGVLQMTVNAVAARPIRGRQTEMRSQT
jgi:hypothetical protein